MKIKKLSNKELLEQIKRNKRAYYIFGFCCVCSILLSHFFKIGNGREYLLFIAIIFFISIIFAKQMEINDKIRLEIREKK